MAAISGQGGSHGASHHLRNIARSFTLVVLLFLLAPIGPAAAAPPGLGDTGIPSDQALGFVTLPEGELFLPLLADPKATRSFVSFVRGTSTSALGTDLGSVGIGDRFPLARWGGPKPGEGVQFGLEGAVFAQFDLLKPSTDLVNADYLVGIPVTMRFGYVAARVRLYHQSSHLGDEYLLSSQIERENFSYEAVEALVSSGVGPLRAYAGGETILRAHPSDLEFNVAHGGAELRPRWVLLKMGSAGNMRVVAGADLKLVEELDWEQAWSCRAGFTVSPPGETAHVGRQWSLLAEYYDGPSPYGQFFRSDVTYYGVGLHFER